MFNFIVSSELDALKSSVVKSFIEIPSNYDF